jgi:hypothetical protein
MIGRFITRGAFTPTTFAMPTKRSMRNEPVGPTVGMRHRVPQPLLRTSSAAPLLRGRLGMVDVSAGTGSNAGTRRRFLLTLINTLVPLGPLGAARRGGGNLGRVLRGSLGAPTGVPAGAAVVDGAGGAPFQHTAAQALHAAPGIGVAAPQALTDPLNGKLGEIGGRLNGQVTSASPPIGGGPARGTRLVASSANPLGRARVRRPRAPFLLLLPEQRSRRKAAFGVLIEASPMSKHILVAGNVRTVHWDVRAIE